MFSLSEKQGEKLAAWQEEQDAEARASEHHYGASGGAYSYTFTPTTLGVAVVVTNNLTKESIDLTDWEDW